MSRPDECPICYRLMVPHYPEPPFDLPDEDYNEWMEEDPDPDCLECLHCGYRTDE